MMFARTHYRGIFAEMNAVRRPLLFSPVERSKYAVVSPVKDEAEDIRRTAAALVAQTYRPERWVIVDDGSSDGTTEIVRELEVEHDWITVIETGRSGERARGGPIVRAFNAGFSVFGADVPEVVVKLDGDIHLPPQYFDWVMQVFERDGRAAIVGGLVLVFDGEEWVPDSVSRRSVHGCAKAYRVAFLDDIGGLPDSMGWDGIDEYGARARGWNVHVLTELNVLHFKQRGSKQSWVAARWEEGVGAHYMGYTLPALVLRVGYRVMVERPPVLGGLTLGLGFVWARLRRTPQHPDVLAREQLAREQRARLGAIARRRRYLPPAPLEGRGPAFWDQG